MEQKLRIFSLTSPPSPPCASLIRSYFAPFLSPSLELRVGTDDLNMANLALNVTIKWKFIIALLSVVALAVLFFYSSLWKHWWTNSGVTANDKVVNMESQDQTVEEKYLSWDDNNKGIFYRQVLAENSKFAVLLLHGARFTSRNWQDIGTFKVLSSKGYTVLAVDLPEHGDSMSVKPPTDAKGKVQFLAELLKKLNLEKPVVVAPSMSGSYAIPFVMNKEHSRELRGFIPVAPGAVANYEADLKELDLPTLIVYGEKDKGFEQYADKMKEIPNSEVFMMKGATHPCYLDNPEEFHTKVLEFLGKLD